MRKKRKQNLTFGGSSSLPWTVLTLSHFDTTEFGRIQNFEFEALTVSHFETFLRMRKNEKFEDRLPQAVLTYIWQYIIFMKKTEFGIWSIIFPRIQNLTYCGSSSPGSFDIFQYRKFDIWRIIFPRQFCFDICEYLILRLEKEEEDRILYFE